MMTSSIVLGIQVVANISAAIVGYIGAAIIVYGALKNGWMFITCCMRRQSFLPELRIDLGKHLALGLEFLIGKDIIESIVEPTWDELGKLAVLVTIRTVVTFILSWELRELKEEIAEEKEHMKAVQMVKKKS